MIAAILRIIAADSIDMYVLDASFFVMTPDQHVWSLAFQYPVPPVRLVLFG